MHNHKEAKENMQRIITFSFGFCFLHHFCCKIIGLINRNETNGFSPAKSTQNCVRHIAKRLGEFTHHSKHRNDILEPSI